MKKLIYFPIVHNQTDLGSFGSSLSTEGQNKYGDKWQDHLNDVDKSWNEIEIEITKKIKKYNKVKIYQDGLPVIGDIGMKIIKDVADQGSKNYKIIEKLIDKGSQIELAEDKELLFKEYNLLSNITKAKTTEEQMDAYLSYKKVSQELLNDRDDFISNQINTTLNDGETGVAFFGAAHSIIERLNDDIKVTIIQLFKDDISLDLG